MRIHLQSSQSKTDQQLTYKETHHRFQKQFKFGGDVSDPNNYTHYGNELH